MPEKRSGSAPTAAPAVSLVGYVVKRDGRLDMKATLESWRSAQDNLPPEEESFHRVLTGFGVTGFLLLGLIQLFGTGVRLITTTPENAVVLADDAARTYASPPCVASGRITARGAFRRTNLREARSQGFAADESCVRAGGFGMPTESLLRSCLIRLHLAHPRASRWTRSGEWAW
jgi:hypothetical protein